MDKGTKGDSCQLIRTPPKTERCQSQNQTFIQLSCATLFVCFLNSHYEAWSCKKKNYKIKAYKKSIEKEPTVKGCLLILGLKPFRSYVKEKHSIGREF